MYKGNRIVIKLKEERQQVISDVYQRIGDNCKAKAMASHRGRDSTYQKCHNKCHSEFITNLHEMTGVDQRITSATIHNQMVFVNAKIEKSKNLL